MHAMKTTRWMFTTLAICGLALAGCKKAEDEPGPTPVYYGVKVDLPKLDAEFANASPALQANVAEAKRLLRFALLPQALAAFVKLSSNTELSESQKAVVNEVIEQVKAVIANSKAPPPQ